MTTIPQIEYDRSIKKLEDAYKQAYKEILAVIVELKNAGETGNIYQQQTSLLRQIEVILTQLNEFNKDWCETEIQNAYTEGMAVAMLSAGEATTLAAAMQGVQFSMVSQQTVEALIADTYNDLLQATNNTERRVKQMVRQIVGDVMRQQALKRIGRVTMVREISQRLTKKAIEEKIHKDGFIGIVDKAGRRWSVERYSKMIAATKLNQAHVEGVRTGGLERGIDTAVISTHNAKDECNGFEGMIISLNGLTEGLLSYEELRESNLIFHPNCQHKVHLVKLDLLPAKVLQKHKEKVAALKHGKLKKKIIPLDQVKVPDKEPVKAYNLTAM